MYLALGLDIDAWFQIRDIHPCVSTRGTVGAYTHSRITVDFGSEPFEPVVGEALEVDWVVAIVFCFGCLFNVESIDRHGQKCKRSMISLVFVDWRRE